MSSTPPSATPSDRRNNFDELRWVVHIRHTLDEELEENDSVAASIFNVPRTLLAGKPEAYVPQLIAVGPYHHWRPELYEMERYKMSAAKRTRKRLHRVKFQDIVDSFVKHEHKMRAHYHRFVDLNGETMAWMMVVDASFLLEFLETTYAVEDGKVPRKVPSRISHLADSTGIRRSAQNNTILRDVVMLENQIPLFVLRKLSDALYSSEEETGVKVLSEMLAGFMKELCPFKLTEIFPHIDVNKGSHLLELLYHLLVPKPKQQGDTHEVDAVKEEEKDDNAADQEQLGGDPTQVRQLFDSVWGYASSLDGGPVGYVKRALVSRPVTFVVKAPWKMITALPGLSMLKQPLENLFSQATGPGSSGDDPSSSTNNINKPPLVEEIMIPSVADLVDSGVRFSPTNGGISTIQFDAKTATFYLPMVTLDVNTEVILRNLVAYEAAAVVGPLVLTRYTEFMNGIIDTEEDVRLLRRSGVVLNRMKSDGEVADMWNGMSRSVRLTRVPFLDRAIEEVNRYHGGRWRVKAAKFMKRYVFGSWPFLTFLAAVLLLLLNALQAFCSAYGCARWLSRVPTGAGR